jgi:hypothetical protein
MREPHRSPLTKADLPEIIQRYRAGESMLTIAKESCVKSRQLYNWVMAEAGEEYQAIQTECLLNRVSDADDMLMKAEDMLQVARAREIARYSRMDLERRRPHLYGPKQEIKQDTTITVIVQRQTPQPVVGEAILLNEPSYPQTGDESQVIDKTDELQK